MPILDVAHNGPKDPQDCLNPKYELASVIRSKAEMEIRARLRLDEEEDEE